MLAPRRGKPLHLPSRVVPLPLRWRDRIERRVDQHHLAEVMAVFDPGVGLGGFGGEGRVDDGLEQLDRGRNLGLDGGG